MAYSKPNPIKQLQSQDQYRQDFEADLMEAGGETPLMQGKSKKTLRKENRKANMEKRIADGSTEFEGGSGVGNFLRKNSYKSSKSSGSNTDLTSYLEQQRKDQEYKDLTENMGGSRKGSSAGGSKGGSAGSESTDENDQDKKPVKNDVGE